MARQSQKINKDLESPDLRKEDSSETKGRFAYEGLHRIFHEKARLGIMTSLLTYPQGLTFNDLKDLCSLSDGNLNRHIESLREEGFIDVTKTGAGRASRSLCVSTELGRQGFYDYLAELQRVLADAEKVSQTSKRMSSVNPSILKTI